MMRLLINQLLGAKRGLIFYESKIKNLSGSLVDTPRRTLIFKSQLDLKKKKENFFKCQYLYISRSEIAGGFICNGPSHVTVSSGSTMASCNFNNSQRCIKIKDSVIQTISMNSCQGMVHIENVKFNTLTANNSTFDHMLILYPNFGSNSPAKITIDNCSKVEIRGLTFFRLKDLLSLKVFLKLHRFFSALRVLKSLRKDHELDINIKGGGGFSSTDLKVNNFTISGELRDSFEIKDSKIDSLNVKLRTNFDFVIGDSFLKKSTFDGEFYSFFSLIENTFQATPIFTETLGCSQTFTLSGSNFKEFNRRSEGLYRIIKNMMKKNENHREELRFNSLEMKSVRTTLPPGFERFVSYLSYVLNDYGFSLFRPFFLLGMLTAISWTLFSFF